ncbi:hypothetical protein KEM55_001216 [Ascosphaera atra]|nr:hypothetical protein KEM55_001216 [Ascosphaera atra]
MAFAERPNVSEDLIWSITRTNNCFLVKRKQAGGVQFSRDPLNLVNHNARKAVGVQPSEKNLVIYSKKPSAHNKPGQAVVAQEIGKNTSNRKAYKAVAATAKNYRSDLIPEAVARASAVLASKKEKKDKAPRKPRGAKATAVAVAAAAATTESA